MEKKRQVRTEYQFSTYGDLSVGWPSHWECVSTEDINILIQRVHLDKNAFHEVMRRLWDLVFSYALRITQQWFDQAHHEWAEDAAQETFIRLYKLMLSCQVIVFVKRYVLTVTRHRVLQLYYKEYTDISNGSHEHKAVKFIDINDEIFDANEPSIEDNTLKDETIQAIKQASYKLDKRSGRVFRLRYVHGLTLQQIGNILGFTRERARQLSEASLLRVRSILELREVL